jgi:hypothetical protein
MGPFDIFMSLLSAGHRMARVKDSSGSKPCIFSRSSFFSRSRTILLLCNEPWVAYVAMAAHASQFVWYRRLFTIFSRYSFMNTLWEIE